MIDVVEAFKTVIEKWNSNNKCGFCWEFEAPMRESDLNESQQKQEDCCIRSFITDYGYRKDRRYNASLQVISTTITHRLTLHFLKQDDIGLNVYVEQAGHPISESKWATILKPLIDCINLEIFCDELGYNLEINTENWTQEIDAYDNNYTGWKVDLTITETI